MHKQSERKSDDTVTLIYELLIHTVFFYFKIYIFSVVHFSLIDWRCLNTILFGLYVVSVTLFFYLYFSVLIDLFSFFLLDFACSITEIEICQINANIFYEMMRKKCHAK